MDIGGGGIIGGGGYEPDFLQPSAQVSVYGVPATLAPSHPTNVQPTTYASYPGYGGYGAVGGSWVPEAPTPTYTAPAATPTGGQVLYAHYGTAETAAATAALTPAGARPSTAAPAVPAAKPKDAEKPRPKTVTVKAGDNLSRIAKDAGVDWKQLYELNKGVIGGNPNVIRPGQELKLP